MGGTLKTELAKQSVGLVFSNFYISKTKGHKNVKYCIKELSI